MTEDVQACVTRRDVLIAAAAGGAAMTVGASSAQAQVDFVREDVVEALAGTEAKFGITAGDIMFDDLSLYERVEVVAVTEYGDTVRGTAALEIVG